METGIYNLTGRQGSTFNLDFTIDTDGTAWNLAGYTAAMQVRKATTSSTALLSLTEGSGITFVEATGSVAVSVSASTMSSLPAGTWVYDLELTAPNGTVYALLAGKFTINAEVTK